MDWNPYRSKSIIREPFDNSITWEDVNADWTMLNKPSDWEDISADWSPSLLVSGEFQVTIRSYGVKDAYSRIKKIVVSETRWDVAVLDETQTDNYGIRQEELDIPEQELEIEWISGDWFEGNINPEEIMISYDFKTKLWKLGNDIYSSNDDEVVSWHKYGERF